MDNLNGLIEEIFELKDSINNELISTEQAVAALKDFENRSKSFTTNNAYIKANALKSLMIIFNITNFSDITILFSKNDSGVIIHEESGDPLLCSIIEEIVQDNPDFYKGLEKIEIRGIYYTIFSESLNTGSTVYTLISLTLSRNFRPTRFHILSDLVMDYIKSSHEIRKGMYNDLFDYTVIELTKFISLFENNEPVVFFFRYEYISEFFNKIGLATIIEISHHIKHKLTELFGKEVSIIRLSLSSYVVVATRDNGDIDFGGMLTKNRINFSFKGILLPYTVVQVPYKKENSIYDIFENVNLLNNYLHNGDVKI
ncbi:MAG TPA: hypothetical protein P5120_00590 [Spirochaetota bacterium]|nr:hypothetical protein [Spirochaetota bacterium]HPF04421.1 hypothetical protein [Spirochaetota bacterium]HPJ40807.1 hypothetical protein [Spirochaetota bacterium]HPR36076.1 hypothetical protein [Spirochaetota bacterium]HRX45990.1 hypothetical protein [Spirochaetota bacterium]